MAQYYCIGYVQTMLLDLRLYVQVSQSVWEELLKNKIPPYF